MGKASIGLMVNRAARLMRRLADQELAPLGLSAGHLPILTALMQTEGLSQKVLAEHAEIEQPTMAATLGRMERDGIIARVPDPGDRRSSLYSLTPATRAKVADIRSAVGRMNTTALGDMASDRREDFRIDLAAMIAALERATV